MLMLLLYMNLINQAFQPCLSTYHYVTREEHEGHLKIDLQTFREHQLYAKFKKYDFWLTEVKFLRHVTSKRDIAIDPFKIEAILS